MGVSAIQGALHCSACGHALAARKRDRALTSSVSLTAWSTTNQPFCMLSASSLAAALAVVAAPISVAARRSFSMVG